MQYTGSWLPNQGLIPCPIAVEAQSLNHWTTRKVTIIVLNVLALQPRGPACLCSPRRLSRSWGTPEKAWAQHRSLGQQAHSDHFLGELSQPAETGLTRMPPEGQRERADRPRLETPPQAHEEPAELSFPPPPSLPGSWGHSWASFAPVSAGRA